MNRPRIRLVIGGCFWSVLLCAGLFSDYLVAATSADWLRSVAVEIQAASRDPGTQWMVVACLVCYLVTFLLLERRIQPQKNAETEGTTHTSPCPSPLPVGAERGRAFVFLAFFHGKMADPNFWLGAFVLLVLARYVVDYGNAATSLQVVVLLAGAVFGKGVALWAAWGARDRHLTPALSPVEAERVNDLQRRAALMLSTVCGLLAAAALWQPEMRMEFQYRGISRWSGPLDNPNIYGLLMGVGVVLALGVGLGKWKTEDRRRPKALWATFYCFAASLCGYGLLRSYSRGAWVATAVGFGFLIWKWASCLQQSPPHPIPLPIGWGEGGVSPDEGEVLEGGRGDGGDSSRAGLSHIWHGSRLIRNWVPIAVILFSGLVVCFWQFRNTKSPLLRRVFSVANINDFSWRNRVAAWQGTLKMMSDRPIAGFGWGKAEEAFRLEYKPIRLEETAAIQVNDYLMIGISCGVPALLCFVAYAVFGFLRRQADTRGSPEAAYEPSWHSATCHAGTLLLLVGFWFDGGLFKLPTAAVFWMLMGLSRAPRPFFSLSGGEKLAARGKISPKQSSRLEPLDRHATPHPGPLPIGWGEGGVPPGEGEVHEEGRLIVKRARSNLGLRWIAGILASLAIGLTLLHVGVPQLAVSDRTLAAARNHLVPPAEEGDFEYLASKPIWSGKPLRLLLQHVHLAHYNRTLVNWRVEDALYQDFVLSPEVNPAFDGQMNWRRPLWEHFYPRVRRTVSALEAANIVRRGLIELVAIVPSSAAPTDIRGIWKQKRADSRGFECLCVAALRSVGIPARLGESGRAEVWTGELWTTLRTE